MDEPMTDARLAEIARVHASVDRCPFTSDRYGVRDVDGDWITDGRGLFWTEELAAFVALSSTAVPELISEIRRLREENERLREENERMHAEAGKLERERMLPGAIVVRDDDETRDRIAQALMTQDAWNPKTLSELDNSNHSCLRLAAISLREDADAVLAALREAYQRGNPMPCLHLDEAAAVLDAGRSG